METNRKITNFHYQENIGEMVLCYNKFIRGGLIRSEKWVDLGYL